VTHASAVLEADGNSLKALYRRGMAYQAMQRYREAHADLSKVTSGLCASRVCVLFVYARAATPESSLPRHMFFF
jgi:hypothetical protein